MEKFEPKAIRILTVDDMVNMRHALKGMLRNIGFRHIIEADDGVKALEILRNKEIDFIISDWIMPRMDGLDLLRNVRDNPQLRNIPFLMMTGVVSESKITQAAETEVDGYIIKPFIENTLEKKILRILQQKKSPSPFEICMKEGVELLDISDYKAAIEKFLKALELKPESARARQALGEALLGSGANKEAERLLKEAVSVNPQYIRGHESLGNLYLMSGRDEEAKKCFETASNISPNNSFRQVRLGKLYIKRGEGAKASRAFDAAIKNDKENAVLRTEIGEAYLEGNNSAKAAKMFQDSINIVEDAHVYNRLGIALRKQGKFDDAIKKYRTAITIAPDDEALYYNLGRAYFEMKDFGNSVTALQKALEIDPEFTECEKLLSNALKLAKQYATL